MRRSKSASDEIVHPVRLAPIVFSREDVMMRALMTRKLSQSLAKGSVKVAAAAQYEREGAVLDRQAPVSTDRVIHANGTNQPSKNRATKQQKDIKGTNRQAVAVVIAQARSTDMLAIRGIHN